MTYRWSACISKLENEPDIGSNYTTVYNINRRRHIPKKGEVYNYNKIPHKHCTITTNTEQPSCSEKFIAHHASAKPACVMNVSMCVMYHWEWKPVSTFDTPSTQMRNTRNWHQFSYTWLKCRIWSTHAHKLHWQAHMCISSNKSSVYTSVNKGIARKSSTPTCLVKFQAASN